jgi:6,7-dimethyl-8-ribityllumazine synthase
MATSNKNLFNYDKSTLPSATDFKIGIVVSQWNQKITNGLLNGALQTLEDCGLVQGNISIKYVPGSFELIYGAKIMQTCDVDVVIAIGCVIQGETKHFDYVCQGVTQGIKDLNVLNDAPVIFCLLTDNSMQQSLDRSGGKLGNKGIEAAITAIKMAALNKSQ